MTERITHHEAEVALAHLYDAPMYSDKAVDSRARLLMYITQQQALEADTVSRAELDEANTGWHERWMRDQKLIEKLNHDSVEAAEQLTALQAELATERARAEEAESKLDLAEGQWARETKAANAHYQRTKKLTTELAAANARVGRLEAACRDGLKALDREWFTSAENILHAALKDDGALSTAPQASTEQASPSPAVGELFVTTARTTDRKPATGGAERCWSCGKEHPAGYKRCGRCNETPEEPEPPTPAEPQGGPEQAGDRRAKLIAEARRYAMHAKAEMVTHQRRLGEASPYELHQKLTLAIEALADAVEEERGGK